MKTNKKMTQDFAKSISKLLGLTLQIDANSTSCAIIYQPKAPKELDRYKKVK